MADNVISIERLDLLKLACAIVRFSVYDSPVDGSQTCGECAARLFGYGHREAHKSGCVVLDAQRWIKELTVAGEADNV